MILEELIARIGFDVRGTDKLKAAQRNLDQYRGALGRMADVARAKLAAYGIATDRAARKTTVFAAANAKAARSGTALRTIFMGLARAAAVVAGGIAGIAVAGAGTLGFLTALSGRAAKVRQEFQLLSKSQGTRSNFASQIAPLYRTMNFQNGDEAAKKSLDELGGRIQKARSDPEEAKKLNDLGVRFRNKDGSLRDTAAVLIDVLRDIGAAGRKEAAAKRPEDRDKANKRAADLGELLDLKDASLERVKAKTPAQIEADLKTAQTRFPAATDADEASAAERAANWARAMDNLSGIVDGVARRLGDLRDLIGNKLLGPFADFTDGLVSTAKRLGWIQETESERNSRLEFEREATRGSGARRSGTVSDDLQLRVSRLEARRKEIEAQPESRGRARSLAEINAAIENAKRDLERSRAAPAAPDQRSMIDWLNESMASAGTKIAAAFEAGTAGQRNYENIGNDQRQQSVTVNVTAQGLGEAAGAVARAVSSSLVKGSTASTAAAGVGP